ncbi:hypothetical protein LF844_17120 [Metapseudomonas lalkuanensis]|uniref:hypothetical protein n=1 Tax=Metapseudomonas lalkuanensis TaxID=2604832 RepID=UPI001CF35558|nr:hypothetical protein [Pseudomonas lalkuanensis]UCO96395.1 hypothetical protein LF844_17120 [Pseudomonas lalkuanensis]
MTRQPACATLRLRTLIYVVKILLATHATTIGQQSGSALLIRTVKSGSKPDSSFVMALYLPSVE